MSRLLDSLRSRKSRRPSRKHRKTLRCETLEPRLMFNADLGDLSVLNDEFNDASTIADWQLLTEVEGWDAQPFETYDIDQTNPGSLTIAPHTSTWYQDYQGDLAFKEVTGDFSVTTQVTITDRDDIGGSDLDDIPGDSWFSLAGVMLRTPRDISDAATEWTPGGANFVFLSLGHGYDGAMSLESKTTQNSVSNLELISVGATNAELRIVREGAAITTLYRLEGDVEWQVAANFNRPDMPETLQVGLLSYSDYEKAATFDPFYANSHTLIDTPENAANSSNPWIDYDPDIQASFDYIRFQRLTNEPATVTTQIDVVNAGFEDITGESPYNEFTFGPLPGWGLYDPGNVTSGGEGPVYFIGTLRPGEVASQPGVIQYFPGGAAEGQRVGIAFNFAGSGDGGEYGFEQTLTTTLAADTTYSLSVDIGNIATGISVSGETFLLDGLSGYRVELLAGGVVIAADDNSLAGSIAEGEFGTSVVTFESGPSPAQLGQPLGIRLINLNQTAEVPAGHDLEVDFDNVRLTATTLLFQPIADQTMASDEVLVINVPTVNAAGDAIAYEVEVLENIAADARDAFAISADQGLVNADYGFNYLGEQERWVQSASGWMFITTEGSLRHWTGSYASSPEVARLDARYHADPGLLVNAEHVDVTAIVSGGQLQISVADGYVGQLHIRLTANDGGEAFEQEFTIDVTAPAWAALVDEAFGEGEI